MYQSIIKYLHNEPHPTMECIDAALVVLLRILEYTKHPIRGAQMRESLVPADSSFEDFLEGATTLFKTDSPNLLSTSVQMVSSFVPLKETNTIKPFLELNVIQLITIGLTRHKSLVDDSPLHESFLIIVNDLISSAISTSNPCSPEDTTEQVPEQMIIDTVLHPIQDYLSSLFRLRFTMDGTWKGVFFLRLLGTLALFLCSAQHPPLFISLADLAFVIAGCFVEYTDDHSLFNLCVAMGQEITPSESNHRKHPWRSFFRLLAQDGEEDGVEQRMQIPQRTFFDQEIQQNTLKIATNQGMNLERRHVRGG
ncbi:hypothetical protein BLNAU_10606 [Blattamonas nauphoetae]|uniref:Uncharacterized protein n=1 Tax=Blattamonas nauphoetae TaxID=2049346 RepID=A0ABQ9XS40_9EUKA|nr:hypothetical protein BLNAU_10606 [Blattamonas nauphoetae]